MKLFFTSKPDNEAGLVDSYYPLLSSSVRRLDPFQSSHLRLHIMAASPTFSSLSSSSKRHHRLANVAMERTCQWIFSQEVPPDVTIVVRETFFSLHKFPLVSKSGYMRRLVAEAKDADLTKIRLPENIPGGAETFELAAKFCYGINFEITAANVAALRLAAEYLEMTEEFAAGNLLSRTEDYLEQVALQSFSGALTVLRACESLLPAAEELGVVSRCIEAASASAAACAEFNCGSHCSWAEELTNLNIDLYQRVLIAMKAKGLSYRALGLSLTLYAQKSLRQVAVGYENDLAEFNVEDEQRILIETIVGLLPGEKNSMPVTFLCGLLRSAIFVNATEACKLDLEKRIALQLDQATVDDLLMIPSSSKCVYGVDALQRIALGFLETEKTTGFSEACYCSPYVIKVCRVMDNYLAEIAHNPNLSVENFVAIPTSMPKHARDVDDSLYRAIDIYLKAHPGLDELQREKVCSIMDCHRLSYEARMHASQNNRLPVHTVVQVLYYDQLRLRSDSKHKLPKTAVASAAAAFSSPSSAAAFSSPASDINNVVLCRENYELKQELANMKMYVRNLQKGTQPKKTSFLSSVSKKLSKLNPFLKDVSKDTSNLSHRREATDLPPRRRRFSIS
uniref:TSA: Wollemia nobilis Ref_Wollemi_Transcript_13449_2016 transcribed RNA sequence n=1 Tax=Wollemia nobilis TaxID=56998 RepID=A0A0C9RTU3_9CONI